MGHALHGLQPTGQDRCVVGVPGIWENRSQTPGPTWTMAGLRTQNVGAAAGLGGV